MHFSIEAKLPEDWVHLASFSELGKVVGNVSYAGGVRSIFTTAQCRLGAGSYGQSSQASLHLAARPQVRSEPTVTFSGIAANVRFL